MDEEARRHIARIRAIGCVVCEMSQCDEVHEIVQGQWFTSLPLCRDCHRGPQNGIHGNKCMWRVKGLDELSALDKTLRLTYGHLV